MFHDFVHSRIVPTHTPYGSVSRNFPVTDLHPWNSNHNRDPVHRVRPDRGELHRPGPKTPEVERVLEPVATILCFARGTVGGLQMPLLLLYCTNPPCINFLFSWCERYGPTSTSPRFV